MKKWFYIPLWRDCNAHTIKPDKGILSGICPTRLCRKNRQPQYKSNPKCVFAPDCSYWNNLKNHEFRKPIY